MKIVKKIVHPEISHYTIKHENISICNFSIEYLENCHFLWNFSIKKDLREKGLGSKSLIRILVYLKRNKVEILKLLVDNDNFIALSLYKKLGFIITNETSTTTYMTLNLKSWRLKSVMI